MVKKLLFLAWLLYDIASATRFHHQSYELLSKESKDSLKENKKHFRQRLLFKSTYNHEENKEDIEKNNEYEQNESNSREKPKRHKIRISSEANRKRRDDLTNKLTLDRKLANSLSMVQDSVNMNSKTATKNGQNDKKMKISMSCDREHERFENCFAGCASVSCDNPRDRLRPCYPFCEPGCICIPPYVRDDRTHKCVMPEDCSKGLKGIPDLEDTDRIENQ